MVGEKVGKKRTLPTLQKILFIFLAFGLLNGCGFHLRGSSGFDFSFVHIKSESADKIALGVGFRMMDEGVQIVPTANAAQLVLLLQNEATDKRILTVSSYSGQQAEFELNYRVEMEIQKPNGTVLLEKQKISLLRDYLFDERAVLAMGIEEEMLREEMYRDIVAQIIRRLQILKLGKVELTQIAFKGLKAKYVTGNPIVVDLIEKTTRTAPIDIWVSLSMGENVWFVTPSSLQAGQLSPKAQPWQHDVPTKKTRHRVLDFTIPPDLSGKFTLRAVYTEAGVELDLNNLSAMMRSTVAEGKIVFESGTD